MSIVDKIHHYQRNIEKCSDNQDRMLHCISKLSNLPVTVQHLQETGVGRTVNALRKYEGGVGHASKALVAKWKAMVANEETSDGEDEDEACVPDAPESYSDSRESPKLDDSSASDVTNHSRRRSEETKHANRYKSENEISSTAHSSKHNSKQDSKLKSNECQYKSDSETVKTSSSEIDKQKKHDKNKHTHKHQSKSEKKSSSRDSRDNKSVSKVKEEVCSSKHQSQSRSESLEKNSSKTSKISKSCEENYKKRKSENTSSLKKESKRRKNSEGESDEEKLQVSSTSEKSNISTMLSTVKIKEEPKDRDTPGKSEVKYNKKDVQEKPKPGSSKPKSEPSSSKLKDTEEKQKEKSEAQIIHKKDDSHHSSKEPSESKSHSSSSSKHHDKNKDRSKKKEHKDGKSKQANKSSGDSKEVKQGVKDSKEVKVKQEINGDEGIDCNSGASFAEALGMCMMAQSSKKRVNNSPNSSTAKIIKPPEQTTSTPVNCKKPPTLKTEPTTSDNLQPPSLLAPNVKLEPLSVDLASTLPEISPNYKPLPYINPLNRREEDKALTDVIYMKNQRTKVYSGNKSGYTSVPSLYDICIRVLIENIDALEFTGGVPYDIIKPVLERASADQLFMLEHYNPYLIEDTDPLWKFHCSREFRNKQREEMESWREMYMRCLDEREAKLKTLTANIKQSIDKSVPLRSTKLAYVDNVVKPPRNILKKQAKYGTANSVPTSASNLKKKLIAGGGPTAATNISVPAPPMGRMKTSSGVVKKTKAPLMAKALQLIKGRYKR